MTPLVSATEERVIQHAARAEHAYYAMLRDLDDQRRRMALMARRVEVNAELNGEAKPRPRPDLSAPLDEAVRHELEVITPRVRIEVQASRTSQRLASQCGPTQITLSITASARRQLRALVTSSRLSIREIAAALGVADRTLERHMAGDTMSAERRDWYARLLRVDVEGQEVHVVTRALPPTRKRWGWFLTRDERRRLISGE